MRKFVYVAAIFFLLAAFIFSTTRVLAQEVSTPDTSGLENQIKQYQAKIVELQGQGKTLSSQIAIMDNQVKLTEAQIANTKVKIANLEKDIEIAKSKVDNLQEDITNSTKALLGRINATYQVGTTNPWEIFLTSGSIENFFTRLKYLRIVQAYDKKTIYAAEQAKADYENQKSIFEDKQAEAEALNKKLTNYTTQLAKDKRSKQALLSETQGSEATYQRLLAQAKAQLAGFSKFAQSQGGASLLSNQTVCDDWGCYYNQRDSQWGPLALNGTHYTLASDGCLVTSMAMVYTHYGRRSVTPITINSDSSNFASYYPAYLLKRIRADGALTERQYNDIDSTLASGHPVVIGISYDNGNIADHFVVFISGSGGNYMMHDPFTPNGRNISFRGRYPSERIVEYEKVIFL